MKKEARKDLIARLEIEIDRQIDVVVSEFQNLNDNQLHKSGENEGWSIVQNLHHLNLYFDYYNPTIEKALGLATENPKATDFNSGWLGSYFTKSMDYRNKGKTKAFKDYIPPKDLNTSEVIRIFIQNEENFLQLIRKASKYNLTKIRLPISLTRWITMRLGDVFQFVTMHNERHIVQAQSRL